MADDVKHPYITRTLLALIINAAITSALLADILPGVSYLSENVVRESAIAFVNTTTSPGIEGATLTVDDGNRQSEQWRSSLGFAAEFTLKNPIYNGYWGLALIGGSLQDEVSVTGDTGQPIKLDFTRDVIALRGSFGLSYPMTQYFKLRPYLSLVVSDLQTEGTIEDYISTLPGSNPVTAAPFKSSAQMISTSGTIDALYSRWYGHNRLELSAHYTLIYTDSFSEDTPVLETEAWNDVLQLKSRFSGPTRLTTSGRPWRWLFYANHTNFLSQENISLGYTSLLEFGAGMEWQMNMKPLDWFGWQMIGLKLGVITSQNVDGYFLGLTAR
jgi:hypothetical protein